ncbi:MAG: hypothetical protein KJ906_00965 [Nanoarchaeota archaeon]|nr:hypothetical protein [Nanoarchaeota archaeon]
MIKLENLIGLNYYLELTQGFRNLVKYRICEKYGSLRQFEIQTKVLCKSSFGEILKENRFITFDKWLDVCKVLKIDIKVLKNNIKKNKIK